MNIQLSDHFTCSRLIRFTLPSVAMMIFTSIYGVVDGIFVSNFAGKTVFGPLGFMVGTGGTALISFLRTLVFQIGAVLLLPMLFELDGIWWSVVAAELSSLVSTTFFLVKYRGRYHYG